MLFLNFESDSSSRQTQDSAVASTSTAIPVDSKKYSANSTVSNSSNIPHLSHRNIVLDEVDEILEKEDGKVERQRNEQL